MHSDLEQLSELDEMVIRWFDENEIHIFCEMDEIGFKKEEQTTRKVYGRAHEYYFDTTEEMVALFVLQFSDYKPDVRIK